MGCSVQELMGDAARLPRVPIKDTSPLVEHPALLAEALEVVLKSARDKVKPLTVKQAFSLAEDAYDYALQKKAAQVDQDFVLWRLSRL